MGNMNTKRSGHAMVFAGDGRIYAIGGRDNSNVALSSIEYYDFALNQWRHDPDTDLPKPFVLGSAVDLQNRILFCAGDYSAKCYVFLLDSNTWKVGPTFPALVFSRITLLSATDAAFKKQIYAVAEFEDGNEIYTRVGKDGETVEWVPVETTINSDGGLDMFTAAAVTY